MYCLHPPTHPSIHPPIGRRIFDCRAHPLTHSLPHPHHPLPRVCLSVCLSVCVGVGLCSVCVCVCVCVWVLSVCACTIAARALASQETSDQRGEGILSLVDSFVCVIGCCRRFSAGRGAGRMIGRTNQGISLRSCVWVWVRVCMAREGGREGAAFKNTLITHTGSQVR